MNKILTILLIICMLPLASALGDRWDLIFSDGTTTINGTDVCLSTGVCLSNVSAGAGIIDTNASTECDGDEVLLGNTSCLSTSVFGVGIVDTNASTACSGSEYLAGDGTCQTIAAAQNPFDQDLNTTANVTFNNITVTQNVSSNWFLGAFNWVIETASQLYLSFNGTELSFNETHLNATIDARASGITESFANDTYVNIDGDNMTSNLSMGNNSISDILRTVYDVTGCSGDTAEGTVCWNPVDLTLDIVTGSGQVIQVGREVSDIGNNTEGSAIQNGQVVYLIGAFGGRPTFKLAKADFHNTSGLVGVVTTDCAINALCPVTVFGSVRGINLTQFNQGDKLYISDTEAGNFTTIPPAFPSNPIWVATVVDNSSDGSLFTFPRIDSANGVTFNELGIVNDIIQTDYKLRSVETDPVIGDNAFCVEMNGTEGELCHFIVQRGGIEQASIMVRSLLIANEVAECLNNTNRTDPSCYANAGGFTWNIDFNTSITGADLGVTDDLEVQGDVWIKSSSGDQKFLSRTLSVLDKFFSDLLLNKLNWTVTGDQLFFIDEEANSLIVNIGDTETILPNNNDTVTLLPGTNSTPNKNFIFYTNPSNPTLTVSTSEPTGDFAEVGRIIFGANYSYASIIDQQSEQNAIQNIFNRFFESGSLYISGFLPNANSTSVNVTGGGDMRIITTKHTHLTNLSSNDFFLVLNNGTYLQCTDIQCIAEYGDGGTIGNIKEFNVVWSITHNDAGLIRLLVTVQNEPPTEFSNTADAEADNRYTVFFETADDLDRYSLPILRTVIRRASSVNTQQTLSNGLFFLDVRGTTKATGAGGASPTISQHNDLTNLEWSVAGHTIDTTLDLSSNSIIGGVDINSTEFYQNGNLVFDTADTTLARIGNCPSGQFVQNTTISGVQCDAPAGGGDITSVQGDDIYIYNGSNSGDVVLAFNETKLNETIDDRASVFGDNSSWNQSLADTLYYGITNPSTYWNDTFATFNKTFADTLYADISVTGDNASWNESHADTKYILQSEEANLDVNSSDFWDNLDTINATQMEDNGGTLNILVSWFTTQWNTIFGTKDTDDLTEGSSNLYDNQSWNETHANTLYADISVDGTVTSVAAGDGLDFTTITDTGSVTLGTPTTLTGSTTNAVTATSHTHEVDESGFSIAASQVTTGTFGTGNYVMDTNLTVERVVFENSANNFIEDNSTCIFIRGATSTLEVC